MNVPPTAPDQTIRIPVEPGYPLDIYAYDADTRQPLKDAAIRIEPATHYVFQSEEDFTQNYVTNDRGRARLYVPWDNIVCSPR